MDILPEEMDALLNSPRCVNCEHREIIHYFDSEGCWEECKARGCRCEDFMAEGSKSNWSPEISARHNRNKHGLFETFVDAPSLVMTSAIMRNTEKALKFEIPLLECELGKVEPTTGKIIRIVKG